MVPFWDGPTILDGFENRRQENWENLFMVLFQLVMILFLKLFGTNCWYLRLEYTVLMFNSII